MPPQAGYLVGRINACPIDSKSHVCAIPADILNQLTIQAIPRNQSSQWVSSRPNSNGNFQLQLSPGEYNVTLQPSTPSNNDGTNAVKVTISPGQTTYQELRLIAPE